METVVISGITGFIGSHLSCHLFKQFDQLKIYGLSRKKITSVVDLSPNQLASCKFHKISPQDYLNRITFLDFDFLKPNQLPDQLRESHCFFHCAAVISMNSNASEQHIVNVKGTEFIVSELQRLKIRSLLYISSVSAHDSRFKELPYFRTKRAAEEIVETITNKNILIPGIVLGAGDLLKKSRKSYKLFYKSPFPFSPNSIVSFTDVHDLCRIATQLGFNSTFNQKFFVCPIHANILDLFTLYRKLSKFKLFPIFPFPKLFFLKNKSITSVNHIYHDNVPDNYREIPFKKLDMLVKESFESIL